MSVLDPLTHALATVVANAHSALTAAGADPADGVTWLASIAVVVVAVRVLLLPVVVHGVRLAHASARARPHLQALAKKYRGRTDAESLRAMVRERREIGSEHGVPRLGCLPVLLQVPIWIALYQLLSAVAAGTPVGAMDAGLVASLSGASVLGVSLADRGYLAGGPAHVAVVAGLALATALMSYLTQRYLVSTNSVAADLPEAMARAQELAPLLSAVGLLVVGGAVPVALLAYWACNALWTMAQSAVVWRWFPTPGSPAAARRAAQGSA